MGFTSTLGFLSVLQMIFMPGFIILNLFGFRFKILLRTVFFSMGLSLLFNYILVFLLVSVGFYNRYLILGLAAVEIIWCLKLLAPILRKSLSALAKEYLSDFNFEYNNKSEILLSAFKALSIIFIIAWFYMFFVKNVGTIFNLWDDVHSWNKWAVEWITHIPKKTWLYPQMLPANWSLAYIMTGTELQFFPKMIQPLFSIMIFLVILDAANKRKKISYYAAIYVTGVFLATLYQGTLFLSSGHVDIATAFFALMSMYCLALPELDGVENKKDIYKYLILGAAFAAAAAVTKQAGLYLLIIYPVLAVIMMKRSNHSAGAEMFSKKSMLNFALPALIIMCAVALPWYILKLITNPPGSDAKFVVALAEGMYAGASYFERLINTIINYPHVYIGILLGFLGLKNRFSRTMLLSMAIPYTIIWALFFSYDLRNNTMVIPMIAFSGTIGFSELFSKLKNGWKVRPENENSKNGTLYKIKFYHLALAGLLFVFAINVVYHKKDSFFDYHTYLEKNIGFPKLNAFLYDYQAREGFDGMILSNYSSLEVLPVLKKYYCRMEYTTTADTSTESARSFFKYFHNHLNNPENKYMLVPYNAHAEIKKLVDRKVKEGKYKMIFSEANAMLVKIRD